MGNILTTFKNILLSLSHEVQHLINFVDESVVREHNNHFLRFYLDTLARCVFLKAHNDSLIAHTFIFIVVGCWHGYVSGSRCRFAYGLADATDTYCLLLQ